MQSSFEIETINEQLDDLLLLARGNVDLVEEALLHALEKRKKLWYRRPQWCVNIEKAAEYINNYNRQQESIQTSEVG